MAHRMNGMHGMASKSPSMGGMHGMDMAHAPPMPAAAKVAPDLSLHVKPTKAGNSALWIQFMGEREVRTVAFIVTVR